MDKKMREKKYMNKIGGLERQINLLQDLLERTR